MYCKHCGKEIDDNSSFCKFCGKSQDNRVSTSNGSDDFITKRPIVSLYILWFIINVVCLCIGDKDGGDYNTLYPKFQYSNDFDLEHYQITDFFVYTILIPLVIFLGYQYFKKVTSNIYRICWGLWFLFHILMYNTSHPVIIYQFFPFTYLYELFYSSNYTYDLSELVFYTMIIPIAYWGYLYYKDKKKGTSPK